jgi:hypothetical protein
MQSIQLKIARREFMSALATLGRFRRKRSVAILPVWLNLVAKTKELQIVEDKGAVTAYVQAEGDWPFAGATVDLFLLRRAVGKCPGDVIILHAIEDALLISAGPWHVRLNLLGFGPESRVHSGELPLFEWATRHPNSKKGQDG